jgi:hypothetical protein
MVLIYKGKPWLDFMYNLFSDKHSSLFCRSRQSQMKNFYNIDTPYFASLFKALC